MNFEWMRVRHGAWASGEGCGRAGHRRDAILTDVKAIRAHIRNGTIVPDEPNELPEGAVVEGLLPESDELNAQDRDELEAEVEASRAEFERGELEDAHAFTLRLVARS